MTAGESIDDPDIPSGAQPSDSSANPGTRAPRPGTPSAAGRLSPAEKDEPAGVPLQEQHHNAEPNAPQHEVVPPGEAETPETDDVVPATSQRTRPDLGTDRARRIAQVPNFAVPDDAAAGYSRQDNEPNRSDR